jgi:cytochrome c-type biogenesis protein CcmH
MPDPRCQPWPCAATARRTARLAAPFIANLVVGLALLAALAWPLAVRAAEAPAAAANPESEARMMALAAELRCLVCQNQNIADSHAGLAVDLRQQIREMLARGQSERQILDYMTERYGDFVLYRPPLNTATALLWGGPALLMAGALGGLFFVLRRRQRLSAEAFDPDTPDDDAPR